ncbi:hypothetical protein BpHYR1_026816 [Brachionus plicatilis]|uniref:Uncharacterized protein n=1 Tax=Brachionus plicatilis TaxID=10195 RepID=A0A3M7QC85_BRAPC|nr:hypothetical protein BpHYR1_026816 [Brachionus plicatilis]
MSSSASILKNNFNDTSNDADDIPKRLEYSNDFRSCSRMIIVERIQRLVKNLHFDNVPWNFHSTNKLADCDKYNCCKNQIQKFYFRSSFRKHKKKYNHNEQVHLLECSITSMPLKISLVVYVNNIKFLKAYFSIT